MVNPKLREKVIWATLDKISPLTTGTDNTDTVADVIEMLLSTTIDVDFRDKRSGGARNYLVAVSLVIIVISCDT